MNLLSSFFTVQLNLIANFEILNRTSISNGTDPLIVIFANIIMCLLVVLVDIGIVHLTISAVKGFIEFTTLIYCMLVEHHESRRDIGLRLYEISQLDSSY